MWGTSTYGCEGCTGGANAAYFCANALYCVLLICHRPQQHQLPSGLLLCGLSFTYLATKCHVHTLNTRAAIDLQSCPQWALLTWMGFFATA